MAARLQVPEILTAATADSQTTLYGVAYALRLREALLQSVPTSAFGIIVVAQLPEADTDATGSICTVRFHKLRANQVWLNDDLDGYRLNAVLAIEFETTER